MKRSHNDLNDRIRQAIPSSSVDADTRWSRLEPQLQEQHSGPASKSSPRRRRLVPAVVVIAAITVSSTAFAASTGILSGFGFGDDAPARKMDVFTEPRASTTPGLSVFDQGDAYVGSDTAGQRAPVFDLLATIGASKDLYPREYARSLLYHHDASFEFELIAIPARDGSVCFVAWHPGGATSACADTLTDETPIRGGFGTAGNGVNYARGLITDDVERVDVVLRNGSVETAILGQNAYFWKGAKTSKIDRLHVVMADGRELNFPPAPPLA